MESCLVFLFGSTSRIICFYFSLGSMWMMPTIMLLANSISPSFRVIFFFFFFSCVVMHLSIVMLSFATTATACDAVLVLIDICCRVTVHFMYACSLIVFCCDKILRIFGYLPHFLGKTMSHRTSFALIFWLYGDVYVCMCFFFLLLNYYTHINVKLLT